MGTFDDLGFEQRDGGAFGVQARYQFGNGYAVSVVRNPYSYGGKDGLYEMAVTTADGDLVYDTPVTDDVLGYLSEDDVTRHMAEVAALPPRTQTAPAVTSDAAHD